MGHEILHVGREKYVPHDRERMVGIHGAIMENDRENPHQFRGARGRVFALVIDDFLMVSHHSCSVMEDLFFLTYM